eukprot:CAMPEP_0182500436 /NCGR_PEP_ID=MMETSP1321-20130603/9114_1 /TAXON_ID=91990 /ORGANISM="Bolidomonas sp., Strain RCC1657" /LENGTH=98 /DNA_ID=CAMNT_0024704855 /DNA_START=225 /DNA_END=521 /DNA_ORIENTATION=-
MEWEPSSYIWDMSRPDWTEREWRGEEGGEDEPQEKAEERRVRPWSLEAWVASGSQDTLERWTSARVLRAEHLTKRSEEVVRVLRREMARRWWKRTSRV